MWGGCNLQQISLINEYFSLFREKKNFIMIISCKDTCQKYFQEFMKNTGYILRQPLHRESYICIISSDNGVIYENSQKNEQVYQFKYGAFGFSLNSQIREGKIFIDIPSISCEKEGLVTSGGYNTKEKISFSEIVINNINYSMNRIGLNFVVIDTTGNGIVVDTFNINTHSDATLKINR